MELSVIMGGGLPLLVRCISPLEVERGFCFEPSRRLPATGLSPA
jgi:hypothetical protein